MNIDNLDFTEDDIQKVLKKYKEDENDSNFNYKKWYDKFSHLIGKIVIIKGSWQERVHGIPLRAKIIGRGFSNNNEFLCAYRDYIILNSDNIVRSFVHYPYLKLDDVEVE